MLLAALPPLQKMSGVPLERNDNNCICSVSPKVCVQNLLETLLLLLLLFGYLIMSDSFVTSWIVAHQAPLFMGLPRQQFWSGLPFHSPGGLPDPGIQPMSPALAGGFLTSESPGKHWRPTEPLRAAWQIISWDLPTMQEQLLWFVKGRCSLVGWPFWLIRYSFWMASI